MEKKERKGSTSRVFKTIIDYTHDACERKLVTPTLQLMRPDSIYPTKEIKINNNNVSHCKRLGLINEVEKSRYQMTILGEMLKDSKTDFKTIFKNQMLTFAYRKNTGTLYPYRTAMEFLVELETINYIQFIYSLYSVGFNHDGTIDIESAIDRAKYIAQNYPGIDLTAESLKHEILNELNSRFNLDFSFSNVWTDRTTVGNQYRYLIRHLELFDDLFELNGKEIQIKKDSKKKVENLISKTEKFITPELYGKNIWIQY